MNVLGKLTEFNIDLEFATNCIKANKHNHVTTTYYLLLQSMIRNGYKSDVNFASMDFRSVVLASPTKFPSRIEKSKEYSLPRSSKASRYKF